MKKFIILLFLSLFILSCSDKPFVAKSDNRFLMGTVCIITLYNGESQNLFDGSFKIVEDEDLLMSLQRENSELSLINANAGIGPVTVSPDIYEVIKSAYYYSELSHGAFDPTIAPLVQLWGIGSDSSGTVPVINDLKNVIGLTDYKKLHLNENNRVFLQEKGMEIDLGGIAKGYIADKVKKYLLSEGVKQGIINLGGNILVIGSKNEGQPWKIGIQNPFETRGNHIGIAEVIDKTIVTSGIYERFFYADGKRYHHILDSETGYPVDNNLASVTIISDKSIDADALSTSLFVLGVKEGLKVIENIKGSEAIFVTKDRKVIYSSGAGDFFTLSHSDFAEITPEEYYSTF